MKKIFIILLLIISYSVHSQFIPNSGDVFVYNSQKWDYENSNDTTFVLNVGEDTLINNQLCKKMTSSFLHCYGPYFSEAYIYEKDSVVYFASENSLVFDTLADFTKK